MRPIDEKIISMKLDNRDFANKAAQTTGIIGALTKTLNLIPGVNLGKTTKELGDIRNQANNTNFNKLAESVQNISNKFTALGIIGVTALVNIANRAVDAGIALGKSLTTDQVTAGFKEYELKIGSIKTILANTQWSNTSLEDVKGSLEELNEYADQTIYSFSQMTQNIGRFTAAGVTLGDSTVAIKGLSNLAATSGSSADQLNTAMYQMSQAMSAGKINLMDWNSLVNAGMGGKVTQDALLKTARSLGVVVNTNQSFRDSIADGWITSKVFLETLKEFGNDQSMIDAATKVRTLTQFIDTLKESIGSGWASTFEHMFGDFEEATELWSGIAARVTGWVGEVSDARNKFFKEAADMGAMQNIFAGVGNAVRPVIQLFQSMKEGFERVFPPVSVARFVQITETFKEFTAGLLMGNSRVSKLTTIFQGVFAIFSTVIEIAKRLTSAFVRLIPEGTGGAILNLLVRLAEMSINFNQSVKAGNGLTDAIDGLGRGLAKIGGFVSGSVSSITVMAQALREKLGGALNFVMGILRPIGAFLKETFSGFGMQEVLGAGVLTGGFLLFKKFGDVLKSVTGLFDTAKDGIGDLLGGLGDALQSFTAQVKYNNLLKIAVAVGILAVSLKLLEGLETEDIVQGVAALGASLGVMLGAMMLIEKFSIVGGIRASLSLIALAAAVSIMAVALKSIAELDMPEILRGVTGLIGVTTALALAVIAMSKWGVQLKVGSIQLIALATSILILSEAIETLSAIDTGQLWKAIAALGVILLELAVFLKIVDRTKFGVSSAVGMVAIAGAIHIMVSAINRISEINTANLVKGLLSITAILAQIVIFSNLAKGPTLIMAGAGLLIIATALSALMIPIKTLSGMTWEELLKGLGGITVAMIAIAGASKLMSGSIAAGLGLLAVAAGLTMLMIPIKAFAAMTWGELLKGFAGLAISMTLVAVASMLLSPAIVPMLGFGAALLLMGASMLAAGLGVGLFGAGLAALAGLTATAIAAIISALKMLVEGLGSLIIYVVKFVVDLGSALLDGIDKLAPKLITTIANLIMKLIEVLVEKLPEFLRLGSEFIIGLINGIGEYVPKIIDAAINMIINVINGITDALSEHGPRIVKSFIRLFGEIILLVIKSGVDIVNALFGWLPGVKKATSTIGETAEKYIRENFGAKEIGEDKGEEFVVGLQSKEAAASTAGKQFGFSATKGLGTTQTKDLGVNFGNGFINGINSKVGDVSNASKLLGFTARSGIQDSLEIKSPSKVTEELGGFTGQGFADGIDSTKPKVKKAAKSVADIAKEQFEASKEWIDERKYYNELSLKEELAAWERIQAKYKIGSEERKQADREVYRVKQELIKADEALIKASLQHSKSWIDERKYYNELSLNEELEAWERVQSRYTEGTEERKEADREVYRLKNELIKTDLENSKNAIKADIENSKNWIEDRKYYNDLSLTEELAAWERVQSRYLEGTEERKQADREVYRLKNELNKQLIQLNDEYTSKIQEVNSKLIDDELRLNEDYNSKVQEANKKLLDGDLQLKEDYTSKIEDANKKLLDDELQLTNDHNSKIEEANKRLLDEELRLTNEHNSKIEDANTKLRDDELRFKEEYERSVIATNDRLISEERRLTEEYERAVEDRTRSLISFAGLFDEIPEKSDVSGQQLMDNLKGQVDTFADWSDNVQELSERGIDEGLLSELRQMGPNAADEIAALNSLTDEQLTEYAGLWKEKNELARIEAISELETLRLDTHSKIEQLKKETTDQLEALTYAWHTNTEEVRVQTAIQMEALKNEYRTKTEEIRAQTAIQLEELKNDYRTKTEEIRAQTAIQLAALNNEWTTKARELRTQTAIHLATLNNEHRKKTDELRAQTAIQLAAYKNEWISKIEELSRGTKDEFVELSKDMKDVGSDTIKGMMSGMKVMEGPLIAQAKAMADAIAATIKSVLKIHSPSQVTRALGAFTGEGLADGIGGQIKNVAGRAKELALTARDSLNNFLDGFGLPEEDNEIRIKAVIEWDGFNPNDFNSKKLRIVPDTSFTTGMVGEVRANQRQNRDNTLRDANKEPQVATKEVNISQNLTFNSQQLTPSEVARKNIQASKQLAMQWG